MQHVKWAAVVGLAGLAMLCPVWAAENRVGGAEASPAEPPAVVLPVAEKTAARDAAFAGDDILEFLNKDKLHGTLMSVMPGEYGMKWKHHRMDKVLDFVPRDVAGVKLAPRTVKKGAADAVILLTNGDMLPGSIESADNEKLVLGTWYAGKLNIKRLMIKSISPNVTSSIYDGPNDIAEWKQPRQEGNQSDWQFKNGALLATKDRPIARNIEGFPDMADIQFDMAWRGGAPSVIFAFYTDNVQDGNPNGNGYLLQVGGKTIYFFRNTREAGSKMMDSSICSALASGTRQQATINLLVDRIAKKITLLVNGQMVKQWVDTAATSLKGNGISFNTLNTGDLRISRIRIGVWDGKIPETTVEK